MKKNILCIIPLLLFQHTVTDFSWKDISSWFVPSSDTTITKEADFDPNGTLLLENVSGSITIKSWNQPKVLIESVKKGSEGALAETKIAIKIETLKAQIKTLSPEQSRTTVDYTLIVPKGCNVNVSTEKGPIKIKQIEGTIQATTEHGTVEITDALNSVTVHATGAVKASFPTIAPASAISLRTQGTVSLKLPPELDARLSAHTTSGSISSTQLIKLDPVSLRLHTQDWNELKKNIEGSLGAGGPTTIDVRSEGGSIRLNEY